MAITDYDDQPADDRTLDTAPEQGPELDAGQLAQPGDTGVHVLYSRDEYDDPGTTEAVVLGTIAQAHAEADRRNLAMVRELVNGSASREPITRQHVVQVDPNVTPVDLRGGELDAAAVDRAADVYARITRGRSLNDCGPLDADDLRTTVRSVLAAYLERPAG